MGIDGGTAKRVTFAGKYNASPAWSPDGKMLAFAGYENDHFDIFVMNIDGTGYANAKYKSVTVLINVDKVARDVTVAELKNRTLAVHAVQMASTSDLLAKTAAYASASGTFTVPPRTTVVFVEN